MILNNSPAIYVDGKMAVRVYVDGELVWGLPNGYTRCKQLESNGKSLIKTNIDIASGDVSASFYIDFTTKKLTGNVSSGYSGVVGINSNPQIGFTLGYWTVGNRGSGSPYPPEIGKRYIAEWKNNGRLYVDNVYTGLARGGTLTITLFYCESKPQSVIIHYVKAENEDGVMLNLIPALDPSGKPCMYDTVSKQPFYNNGTGEFGYELMDGTYVAPI